MDSKRIMHRDLKPENMILKDKGKAIAIFVITLNR